MFSGNTDELFLCEDFKGREVFYLIAVDEGWQPETVLSRCMVHYS